MSTRVQPKGVKPAKVRKITAAELDRLQRLVRPAEAAEDDLKDAAAAFDIAKAAFNAKMLPAAREATRLKKLYRCREHEEIDLDTGEIRPIPPKSA